MSGLLKHRATAIWLILSLATCLSSLLGHEAGTPRFGSLAIIVIAIFKVRLVLLYFMELQHAPLPWRLAFEGWMVVLTVALIALYLDA